MVKPIKLELSQTEEQKTQIQTGITEEQLKDAKNIKCPECGSPVTVLKILKVRNTEFIEIQCNGKVKHDLTIPFNRHSFLNKNHVNISEE